MTSTSLPRRAFHFAVAATFSLSLLTGCLSEGGTKQNMGTLLGGVGGALAGSKVGSGRGQLVAVAVGTMLGGLLGNEIGKSLDRADRQAMAGAQQRAMVAPVGDTISWRNPESGHHGAVRTTREGTSSNGMYCREYQQTVVVGGESQEAYGTACRQPDGQWQVIDDNS
ncbi:MAG: RT0821/Lpp0805 family surface protein [Alphaproteobacteria bacterium]|nr:RT0821/Lpp0805 family surface protein [Alphaproteobacteria bacterium]MDP6567421.1 RT0821/Lpp0805 family surface protein [Alphaproteobacteria bacterium]MDP6814347.1 RT0821/Lpp0805 family surface protein [Alphaproteobacteria bacterium]